MKPIKDYLGDSVYVEYIDGQYILTTDNGEGPSNTIILEPAVIYALNQFIKRINPWNLYDYHLIGKYLIYHKS